MYSQHGEDTLIEKYLIDNKIMINPIFVDIGAYNGINDSNSLLFREKYGYIRYLVDANPIIREIKDEIADQEFIVTEKGLYGYLEVLNGNWGLATVKTAKKKTKNYDKECITIQEYLKNKELTEKNSIGVLSLDIEGNEDIILLQLLKETKVRPYVICVEGNTNEAKEKIRKVLKKDYIEIGEISVNLIFIRKDLQNK
jgi:hypothetical protein